MLAGSVIAVTQTDMKRLLAYSSVAQAGYVLTGVVAASVAGLSSTLFYLAAYGISIAAAFAVLPLVRDPGGEAGHLSRWAGLGHRSPLVAGVFAFFLIAFPYVRVIVLMYFREPPPDAPVTIRPGPYTRLAVTAGAVVTLWLGIVPQPLLDLASQAANSLFVR